MNTDKFFYRQEFRWIRDAVKSEDKDTAIFEMIIGWETYKSADTVFVYYSVGSEVDTLKIIENALVNEKKVAIPKCIDESGNMEFYFINDTDKSLIKGSFRLLEPDVSICEKAYSTENTLCIVPALAFDKNRNRLGYGGGYYDRYLSKFKGKTVGLCYAECFCDELPCDMHDIKVQSVMTDKSIYELK